MSGISVKGPFGPGAHGIPGAFFVYSPSPGYPGYVRDFTNYKDLMAAKLKQSTIYRLFETEVILRAALEKELDDKRIKIELTFSVLVNGREDVPEETSKYFEREAAKRLHQAFLNRMPEVAKQVEMTVDETGKYSVLLTL
jgi:hypothetical protein